MACVHAPRPRDDSGMFSVQLSTASIPQRCCVSVGMVKGATATPSAQALGVWQEGRHCAVGGRAPSAGLRRSCLMLFCPHAKLWVALLMWQYVRCSFIWGCARSLRNCWLSHVQVDRSRGACTSRRKKPFVDRGAASTLRKNGLRPRAAPQR